VIGDMISLFFEYIVVSGDTCNGIGAEFNVTGSSIISANPSIK